MRKFLLLSALVGSFIACDKQDDDMMFIADDLQSSVAVSEYASLFGTAKDSGFGAGELTGSGVAVNYVSDEAANAGLFDVFAGTKTASWTVYGMNVDNPIYIGVRPESKMISEIEVNFDFNNDGDFEDTAAIARSLRFAQVGASKAQVSTSNWQVVAINDDQPQAIGFNIVNEFSSEVISSETFDRQLPINDGRTNVTGLFETTQTKLAITVTAIKVYHGVNAPASEVLSVENSSKTIVSNNKLGETFYGSIQLRANGKHKNVNFAGIKAVPHVNGTWVTSGKIKAVDNTFGLPVGASVTSGNFKATVNSTGNQIHIQYHKNINEGVNAHVLQF